MEKVHLRTRLCPPLTSLGSGAGAWSRVWSPWLQAPHGAHVSVTEPMTSRTEKCWVKAGGQSDCRSDKQHRCPEAQTCESGPRRAAGPTDSCPAPVAPAPPALRGGPGPVLSSPGSRPGPFAAGGATRALRQEPAGILWGARARPRAVLGPRHLGPLLGREAQWASIGSCSRGRRTPGQAVHLGRGGCSVAGPGLPARAATRVPSTCSGSLPPAWLATRRASGG